jgi:hypothetical protein
MQAWSGARDLAADDRRPRWPATEPITLEALAYGRHAAPERWLPRPPRPLPRASRPAPAGARAPAWQGWWAAVRDVTVRLGAGRGTASPAARHGARPAPSA